MHICTPTPEEAHSLIWPDEIIMEATLKNQVILEVLIVMVCKGQWNNPQ